MNTLQKLRYSLGIPSTVLVTAFLFGQSIVQVILDLMPAWQMQLIWLFGVTMLLTVTSLRWQKSLERATLASQIGQSGDTKLQRRRGLIIVLDLDSAKEDGAVARLLSLATQVEYIAFIGTAETKEKRIIKDITEKLMPLTGHSLPATHHRSWEEGNAQSIADFEEATQEAINWLLRMGLEEEEIVVDISGGRRPMGYGANMASDRSQVEVQYLASPWNQATNTPDLQHKMFKVMQEIYPA